MSLNKKDKCGYFSSFFKEDFLKVLFQNKLEKYLEQQHLLQQCNVFSSSRCLLSICHFIKNANVFQKEDDLVTPWFVGSQSVEGHRLQTRVYCTKQSWEEKKNGTFIFVIAILHKKCQSNFCSCLDSFDAGTQWIYSYCF